MTSRLLRLPAVLDRIGIGQSLAYAQVVQGLLPKPVKIQRCSAWPEAEIDAVIAARIAGASDDEMKVLVANLMAARKRPAATSTSQKRLPRREAAVVA